MPKENTHIYFADTLLEHLDAGELKDLLNSYRKEYYFGSISPDIYFYHREEEKTLISSILHGCSGEKTNRLILAILKDSPDERDFAFAAGYMTHTVLDMTFHPIVYYLAGNYYDEDPDKGESARYRHRYLETALDMMVKGHLKSNRLFSPKILAGLRLNEFLFNEFGVKQEETAATFRRQLSLNRLMTGRALYPALQPFTGSREIRGLFYGHVSRRDRKDTLDTEIEVKDIFTGEKSTVTFNQLFARALKRGIPRLNAMFDYFKGNMAEKELEKVIPGESLDTGSTERTISGMRYSIND